LNKINEITEVNDWHIVSAKYLFHAGYFYLINFIRVKQAKQIVSPIVTPKTGPRISIHLTSVILYVKSNLTSMFSPHHRCTILKFFYWILNLKRLY